jgi:hypothetical protein
VLEGLLDQPPLPEPKSPSLLIRRDAVYLEETGAKAGALANW